MAVDEASDPATLFFSPVAWRIYENRCHYAPTYDVSGNGECALAHLTSVAGTALIWD